MVITSEIFKSECIKSILLINSGYFSSVFFLCRLALVDFEYRWLVEVESGKLRV